MIVLKRILFAGITFSFSLVFLPNCHHRVQPKEQARKLSEWANDPTFKRNSQYNALINSDIAFHKRASILALKAIAGKVKDHGRSLRFLDLASGTDLPAVPNYLFSQLTPGTITWHYTGVDINKDLASVKSFAFPASVKKQTLLVANAYDLNRQKLPSRSFDVIYSGLNFHHLSAKELTKTINDCYEILEPGGFLVIHDLIRPQGYSRIEKPDDRLFVPEGALEGIRLNPVFAKTNQGANWKTECLECTISSINELGMDEKTKKAILDHVAVNEFPFSFEEYQAVLEAKGFKVQTQGFAEFEPRKLAKFFGLIVAQKV